MVALFGTFNNQCTFFRRGSADGVHFSRIISYDGLLDKATTPPFRHLSSRRGLVRLPLREAVNAVDCGVATSQNYVYHLPPLRFSGTSPQ